MENQLWGIFMKAMFIALGLLAITNCKNKSSLTSQSKNINKVSDQDEPTTDQDEFRPTTNQNIHAVLSNIDENNLKANLDYLASDELAGRGTGQPGGDLARDFVIKEFKSLGLEPAGDNKTYRQDFSTYKGKSSNVIGILTGNDPVLKNEFIVIGAHYDHLGHDGQTIFNGADDNASGTAAIISIAKSFKQAGSLRRSILFIAFGAEELQTLGSQHWVENPTVPLSSLKFMINLDMIAKANTEIVPLGIIGLQTSPEVNQLVTTILQTNHTNLKAIDVDQIAGAGMIHQARSDQTSFVNQGIPATFFTIDPSQVSTYHKPTDTSDLISMDNYLPVVKFATEISYRIANLEKITPGESIHSRFSFTSFLLGNYSHSKWGCNGLHGTGSY